MMSIGEGSPKVRTTDLEGERVLLLLEAMLCLRRSQVLRKGAHEFPHTDLPGKRKLLSLEAIICL